MNNEYIVVMGGAVVGDSSQIGPARRAAEAAARTEVGSEAVLYKRVNTYKAWVIVEDDAPKSANVEEA